jgi:sorbitol-specific phosphotransferase system component IIBC
VRELQKAGYDMTKLSIVGKDYHTEEHVTGYYSTGDRMKYWGKLGAFWGGLWGLLFGAAFFAIPGLGPVLAAGPIVAWIVGALEGAVVTAQFLLIAHGGPAEVTKAQQILRTTPVTDLGVHVDEPRAVTGKV